MEGLGEGARGEDGAVTDKGMRSQPSALSVETPGGAAAYEPTAKRSARTTQSFFRWPKKVGGQRNRRAFLSVAGGCANRSGSLVYPPIDQTPRRSRAAPQQSMKLRNINGTSDTTCKCGSWLLHWKKFGGSSLPEFCPETGCVQKDLVGAHVQLGGGSTDQRWYICPLCSRHNKHVGELSVTDTIKLVSASKAATCDR